MPSGFCLDENSMQSWSKGVNNKLSSITAFSKYRKLQLTVLFVMLYCVQFVHKIKQGSIAITIY
jgi:hypothetical protein